MEQRVTSSLIPIADNVFVEIFRGNNNKFYVDTRKYVMKDHCAPQPTNKGISLDVQQFVALYNSFSVIRGIEM